MQNGKGDARRKENFNLIQKNWDEINWGRNEDARLKRREDWYTENIFLKEHGVGSPYDMLPEGDYSPTAEKHKALDDYAVPSYK